MAKLKKLNPDEVVDITPPDFGRRVLLISLGSQRAVKVEADFNLPTDEVKLYARMAATNRASATRGDIKTTIIGLDRPKDVIVGPDIPATPDEQRIGIQTVQEVFSVIWYVRDGGDRDPSPQTPPAPSEPLSMPRRRTIKKGELVEV